MTRVPRSRHLLSVTVLALLAVTLVGHVCVLPLHGHAATEERHHEAGDSVHGASCEVLRSTPSLTWYPIVHTVSLVDRPVETCSGAFEVFSAPLSVHSPPLFLLHAALLI
jgi:hypothetical protein